MVGGALGGSASSAVAARAPEAGRPSAAAAMQASAQWTVAGVGGLLCQAGPVGFPTDARTRTGIGNRTTPGSWAGPSSNSTACQPNW
jgi:hypothetical protein